MHLLVSLHDVTPAHAARLDRAEALLAASGIDRVAFLLVPDFHRQHPIADDRRFIDWCRRSRPFAVEWILHGFYHAEDPAHAAGGNLRQRLARRFMTGSEGEFLDIDDAALGDRLGTGRRIVTEVIGAAPRAFIAPAWLFNSLLLPGLARQGFEYTEDHLRVIDVTRRVSRRCPVVSWATRTVVHRVGSRLACPAIAALIRREPAIRLAIHPFDMEHSRTVGQIRRVLDSALARRHAAVHADLFDR